MVYTLLDRLKTSGRDGFLAEAPLRWIDMGVLYVVEF